jgi:hypothetical protein
MKKFFDQPQPVIDAYKEYVEAKKEISEPALTFREWAKIEKENNSPIGQLID